MNNIFNGVKATMHIGKGTKKCCQAHNNRTDKREHTNTFKESHHKEKEHLNEYLIDIPLEDFFHQEFDKPLADFNAKQTRKDRIKNFDDYYKEHKKDCYEMIVQLGNEDNQPLTDEQYVQAYKSVVAQFQDRYPSLKVFGAYIHLDETTPHLHLDFIPVADGKRGLTHFVSTSKALEELGWKQSNKYGERPFVKFIEDCREFIEEKIFRPICPSLIKSEKCEISHQSQNEYWRDRLNKEKAELQNDVKEIQEQKLVASKKNLFNKGNISIPKEEYESLLADREKLKANYLDQNNLNKAIQRQESISKNAEQREMQAIRLYASASEMIEEKVNDEVAKRTKALNTDIQVQSMITKIGQITNERTKAFTEMIEQSKARYEKGEIDYGRV